MVNVTVLKDEALGVDREYMEVKRKAAVGERIKIVAATHTFSKYGDGDVFVVDRVSGGLGVEVDAVCTVDDGNDDGFITNEEYVVLEPSNIIRIDGGRYRMVERKAAVDESVIIVVDEKCYPKGSVHTVDYIDSDGDINFVDDLYAKVGWYHVLEPVESIPRVTFEAAEEDIAESDAALIVLTRKVNTLDAKVSEQAAQIEGLTDAVAKLAARAYSGNFEKVASGPVSNGKPSFAEPVKPPSRDEIIERAKADVAELERTNRVMSVPALNGDVDFVINRNKRTVVALIRYIDGDVWARGIAKAAPGDCFNEFIGRAISLRRALGLTVPDEYVNAPQPSEARVGDIVFYSDMFPRLLVTEIKTDLSANPQTVGIQFLRTVGGTYVIDDSRTEVSE